MNKYLMIYAEETCRDTFKAIIEQQKPINAYESFECEPVVILEIPRATYKGLYGISCEWLTKEEFKNMVSDYDLRNDLIEEVL